MLSLQTIFNNAWQHFIVEDHPPAVDPIGGGCSYLTPTGEKCAIGVSLPEDISCTGFFLALVQEYPSLFDANIHSINASDLSHKSRLNEFQKGLHDNHVLIIKKQIGYIGEWKINKIQLKQAYLDVAKDFGLTVPE